MDKELLTKIIELRHRLHRHPEISMREIETCKRIMEFLMRETSLEIYDKGLWGYAYYDSGKNGAETIAFRADMDALPIDEKSGLPYCSVSKGVSHMCGHDGHSATLAALCCMVDRCGADKNIYFIFQHAEETGDGAKECAQLITDRDISEIYAFHNWSGYPEGSVILGEGVVQCASKGVTFDFVGKTSHASRPEDGRNPAEALSQMVLKASKMKGVTTVGLNIGGKNFGISPGEGAVSFTLRAPYEKDIESSQKKLSDFAKELAAAGGFDLSTEESDVFPETINDAELSKKVRKAAEKCGLEVKDLDEPLRSSEDFGYFQKRCPGVMMYIGNGIDYPQIHTNKYDFNDAIIETTAELLYELCGGNAKKGHNID